ncbi:DUF4369 domain-containing protein [Galbibacter mesophilus]|uniref:DUF4369 domain-containing protein n=1 Tax=Galbibacter mesophilus TaxID=379069 RepID=UPI00191D980F|nr:DUF4369 domain-containing protein [Galbibacter mesophilus]MCM5661779.1 DUF4369 domain-containing protein [Galbibacter mesophilus]
MYRLLLATIIAFAFASCGNENDNMTVNGTIEGLRKGTVYFQKVADSTLVTIDSVVINGNPTFNFSTNVESPEVFSLYLDKNDGNNLNDRLDFFGEPGAITITTSRDYFAPEAKVEGSKSHEDWMSYKKIISKFSEKNLELIKETLEAQKEGKLALADSLQKVSNSNLKRSYLYTLNFIFNHSDSYTAPYITLTDAYNTNVKYLDSINNSLSDEVAESKYGKMLQEYIEELKSRDLATDSLQ